jgi:hypothetical protein
MKEAYRKNKTILTGPATSASRTASIVFMVRVRGRLPRQPGSRKAIEQAVISLLKDLHHHLFEKP